MDHGWFTGGRTTKKLWYDGDTHNTVESVAALFVSFINWQKSNSEWFQLGSSRSSESHGNRCLLSLLFLTRTLQLTVLLVHTVPWTERASYVLVARINLQGGRPSCISCGLSLTTHSSGTVDKKHCISKLINSNCNISCGVRHILVNWCSFSLNSAVALLTVDGNSAFSNVRCNIFSGLSYRRQIIHFQIVLERR